MTIGFEIEPGSGETETLVPLFYPADDDKSDKQLKVKLYKWLWAARFFTTKELARLAIEDGKVLHNGQPAKSNMEINLDDHITLQQTGHIDRTVVVKVKSTKRHNAEEAKSLYEEHGCEDAMKAGTGHPWQRRERRQQVKTKPPYSNEYPNTQASKKPVRFLRRSMSRTNQSDSTRTNSEYSDHPY